MSRTIARSIALAALAVSAGWAQVTPNCTPITLPELVGTTVNVTCAPTGGTAPYTWIVSVGKLPKGLSQDLNTGAITGKLGDPAHSYNFTVQATDSSDAPASGTQMYSGATVDALTVSCTPTTGPVEVGVAYSDSCTAAGGTPPYAWSISGTAIPPGLSITPTVNPATVSDTPASPMAAYQYNVVVTDSSATQLANQQQFSGAIAPAVAITTASPLPAAVAGTKYSQQFALTGGVAPFNWTATGLSDGLTMNPQGLLSGTPPSAATVSFTATVTDSAGGMSSGPYTVTVNAALTITTVSPLPAATIGTPYSQTLAVSGGTGPYQWTVGSGSLPDGLSLSTAGKITGTPLATAVTSTFTVKVTDSNNSSAAASLTLPVNLAITTTSPLPAATIGVLYNQTLTAVGGAGGYTWAGTTLPSWLKLNGATGALAGTPPATAVDTTFSVTVTDSSGGSVAMTFSLPVTLAITTQSPLPAATIGTAYTQTFAASGGAGGYTWSATGLPAWLALSPAGVLTTTASGPPATATDATFTVKVTDSATVTASGSFTVPVTLSITTASPLPTATANTAYSQTFTAAGGSGGYTWSAAQLPAWASLSAGGVLTATPPTPGSVNFSVTVKDSTGVTQTGAFTLPVIAQLSITTSSPLANGIVNVAYNQALNGTGGVPPYTWSLASGSALLPPGLTISSSSSSGTISGQPTATGTYPFTIQLSDSATPANTVTKPFVITVSAGLAITTPPTLPNATVGVAYQQTLAAAGGAGPYTWAITSGSLPVPLSLNSSTGQITGIPTATGTANFTVTVTDSASNTAKQSFTLTVVLAPVITTASPLPNGTVNAAYTQSLTGSGGTPPYTWTVASGSLPAGLSLSTAGVIGQIPNAAGTSNFTVLLKDATGVTASKPFSLTIVNGLVISTLSPLPTGEVNFAYSQQLAAAGGTPPYKWMVASGSLPAGLSLSTAGSTAGAITGMPSTAGTSNFTVQVTDSAQLVASKPFALTIVAGLTISTASPLPTGEVNSAYSQTLTGVGGAIPYKWVVASGVLPPGLSLSSTGGGITGTPRTAGTSNFTVQLTDATGVTTSKAFALTIVTGLTISTASPLPTGEVNIPYSQTLAATGGTSPYTWSVSAGTPPPGLTLANGVLAGKPTTAGTFSFTVQAADINGATANAVLSVTIVAALGISTPAALSSGSVGVSYSQILAATPGVAPYKWSLAIGPLPQGLTLSPTGNIAGSPTAIGTYPFTVNVTDALGATASRQFTIAIAIGLTIATPPTLPAAIVGAAYSELLQASGGTVPYTWTVTSGSTPAGLKLSSNGNLVGIPTAAGASTFTVQVSDTAGHQASEQFSITVAATLSITTSALPGGTVGAVYSQPVAATGGTPPYTWTVLSGALPDGLALSTAGSITGTPKAAGTFSFTVKVADSAGFIADKKLSITVAGGISITTAAALPNASLNTSYSQTLGAAGGTPPYKWTLMAGALPLELTLSLAGAITGTPTAAGTFQFTATVTDSASGTASQQFTLIVGGGLAISIASLPAGKTGVAYSQTLTATGGTPPYTFATSAGSLPPGITLKGAVLSGTPNKAGSYTFTIQATDSASSTATQQFTIAIAGLAITTSGLPGAAVGTAYSETLAAAGIAPYTWIVAQGSLPVGLSLNASGTIGGMPTSAGTSNVTIKVTDSTGATASAAFSLTVISASFSGLSSTGSPAQQISGALALGTAYPQQITGQVTLTFQPDASLASPADDPSIQFSGGGRAASFTIPANSTAAVPFSLQTGTVAGTITLTVTWQAGGTVLATPAALTQTIQIAPAVPVISAVTASTSSSGFQVVVTGYSNTREVSQAVIQFTAAAGQTLQTPSVTVPLSSAATAWFQSSASDQYGGQFILTLPFTVSNGSAGAIASVSVQLVNSQGNSASASATL